MKRILNIERIKYHYCTLLYILYFIHHSAPIVLPERFLTLKDHGGFPVASTATPYPRCIEIGGCDACECIVSLYAYIS